MKNFILYIASIMVISFVIGMAIFTRSGSINLNHQTIDQTKIVSLYSATKIEVSAVGEDINFFPSAESELKVRFHGEVLGKNGEEQQLVVEEKPDSKLVKISVSRPTKLQLFANYKGSSIDIYIPQDKISDVDAVTVSGKVTSQNLTFDNFFAKSTSGLIRLDNYSGKLRAVTTSGKIDIVIKDLNADLDMESTSGKVSLTLPNSSGYNLAFNTTSGRFQSENTDNFIKKLPFEKNIRQEVGDGRHRVDVKTISGNLELITR